MALHALIQVVNELQACKLKKE